MPSDYSSIVLTGSGGYLGGRVQRLLLEQRRHVLSPRIDLLDQETIKRTFQSIGAGACLVHLAAANEILCAKDFGRCLAVNCVGTKSLLDIAAAAQVRRVVFFSTFHVYGDARGDLLETSPTNPTHPYAMSKQLGEQLCRVAAIRAGFSLAIVRLSNAIGAPADPSINRWSLLCLELCRQAHEHGRLKLRTPGWQQRDFLGVGDVGQALCILLDAADESLVNPVFNLGSGRSMTVRALARCVQEQYAALYSRTIEIEIPRGEDPGEMEVRFSVDRLRALGYLPAPDLNEEIRDTLRFCERFAKE